MKSGLLIISIVLNYFQAFSQAVFQQTDCFLSDCNSYKGRHLVFGKLLLDTEPGNDTIKPVEMAIVIIKAKNPAPLPDPIIYLPGGPGQKAIYGIEQWLKEPYGFDRDIILFDPRGVGYSSELLPHFKDDYINVYKRDLSYKQAVDEFIELFYKAKDTLKSQNVDISLFNSTQIAKDVKQLIDALGYKKVNIYSGSYGTKYAQAIIRDYPEIVRSAVLDSPVPYSMSGTGQAAFWIPAFNRSISMLDRVVESHSKFHDRYGSYSSKFYKILDDFKNNPLQVSLFDGSEFIINDFDLFDVYHFMHYNADNYAILPWLLEAADKRDTLALKTIFGNASRMFEVVNMTTYLLTMLNDGHDPGLQEEFKKGETLYPLLRERFLFNLIEYHLYIKDKPQTSDPFALQTITSQVPVLLLSGELDPATPPYFADSLKKYFTNAFSLVLPYSGHAVTVHDCGAQLMTSYINDPGKLPKHICINSPDKNPMILTSVVYNPRLFHFVSALLLKPDIKIRILTVLAIVPALLLVLMITSIRIYHHFKKSKTHLNAREKLFQIFYSLSLLIFFGFLLYGFFYAGSKYPALLAIGLPGNFKLLFFLPYLIIVFAVIVFINNYRTHTVFLRTINLPFVLTFISFAAFLWLSFLYWL